jgi:hypothetical protein
LKVYTAVMLVAVAFLIAPPAAFAQRSGTSRGGGGAGNPRGDNPPARVETGQLLPGTPGSAYRSRLEPRPFLDRGVRGRSLSYWWWGLTYGGYPEIPDDNSREVDVTPAPPRRIEPPAESSLIQPMLTLPRPQAPRAAHGNLQLEVAPSTAQVYVDGFFVGTVEDISHLSGGLNVGAGWHRLEFRAPGYVTPAVNITIDADRTFTYRGELKPIAR